MSRDITTTHGNAAPTRTQTDCCANTCTGTLIWPRSLRTSSTPSLRNSTTAHVEYLAGPLRPRRSALPCRNRCCVRLPGAVSRLRSSLGGRWRTSRARRRPRATLVRRPGPRARSRRDARRMRHHPKTSDHLRMPTALARGLWARLDPIPDRPAALHQDHRTVDAVLARPEPEIPPLPPARPQPTIPRPARLPRRTSRPHLLGLTERLT